MFAFIGLTLQSDWGGKVNILEGGGVWQCQLLWEKKLFKHVSSSECLPRYSCFNLQDISPLDFLFFGVGWRAKFTKEGWTHETNCTLISWMLLSALKRWRLNQTKNRRSSHTSCKVHRGWRCDFGTATNCHFCGQTYHLNIKLKLK